MGRVAPHRLDFPILYALASSYFFEVIRRSPYTHTQKEAEYLVKWGLNSRCSISDYVSFSLVFDV